MLTNQLISHLFISSMVFTITFGLSGRNNNRAVKRIRRQLDLNEYLKSCKDECIMSNRYALSEGVYSIQQLHSLCMINCKKNAKNILENYKKQQEEKDFHRPLTASSSSQFDCEIKCLANKHSSPSSNSQTKRRVCRQQCSGR